MGVRKHPRLKYREFIYAIFSHTQQTVCVWMTTRIWALFVKGRRPDTNSTGHPLRAVSTDAAVRVPQAQRCGTTGGRPDAAMQDRAWAVPEASAGAAPQHSGVCDTRKGTPVPRLAGRSRGKALPRPPKWSSVPASFRPIQRKVHAAGVRGRVVVGSGSTGPAQGPQGASLTCALTPPMERSARRLLSAWRFAPVAAPLSPPPDTALCRVVLSPRLRHGPYGGGQPTLGPWYYPETSGQTGTRAFMEGSRPRQTR